jgi:hypothetical protein
MLDLRPDAPLLDIRYDAGPIQARRVVERMLAAERGAAASAAGADHVPA